jgi:hypothetical protein
MVWGQMLESLVGWMERVFAWLQNGVSIVIVVWVLVVLPLLIFRKTREIAAAILGYSSIFTGFTCWWYSFIICYRVLGTAALIVGVLFGGIGVVPLAVVGVFIRSFWAPELWVTFWNLILALALVFGPRVLVAFIAYRIGEQAEREDEQRYSGSTR